MIAVSITGIRTFMAARLPLFPQYSIYYASSDSSQTLLCRSDEMTRSEWDPPYTTWASNYLVGNILTGYQGLHHWARASEIIFGHLRFIMRCWHQLLWHELPGLSHIGYEDVASALHCSGLVTGRCYTMVSWRAECCIMGIYKGRQHAARMSFQSIKRNKRNV